MRGGEKRGREVRRGPQTNSVVLNNDYCCPPLPRTLFMSPPLDWTGLDYIHTHTHTQHWEEREGERE